MAKYLSIRFHFMLFVYIFEHRYTTISFIYLLSMNPVAEKLVFVCVIYTCTYARIPLNFISFLGPVINVTIRLLDCVRF